LAVWLIKEKERAANDQNHPQGVDVNRNGPPAFTAVDIGIALGDPGLYLKAEIGRSINPLERPKQFAKRAVLGGSASGATEVDSWDASLTRFGADTLNKRYASRGQGPMTGHAWGAWFAVKCVWEAALQSKATSAADIITWMEKPTTRFDGHKGAPLHFNSRHELVQPLYLKRDGKVVDEVSSPESNGAATCDWKD